MKSIQTFFRQRAAALRFDTIADPRDPRGVRWKASTLISTAVLSLMMLARSLRAAENMSEDLAHGQKARGIVRRVPDSTLGDFLSKLSPRALRRHLHRLVLDEHRRKALEPTVLPIRAISIDGKVNATVKTRCHPACQDQSGEATGDPRYLFRVANCTLISAAAPVCIDQMPIPAATNDMGVFKAFFATIRRVYSSLFDVVTMDAGFASEENARQVNDADKGYVISLKGNQPDLFREARRVFAPLIWAQQPEAQTDWESDSSRGFIKRELYRTDEMAGWGAWTHLRQVWLVRVLQHPGRDKAGPIHVLEERYYVTNLVRGRLSASAILDLIRAHWRIENNLHGSLDIHWKEDQGLWVRRGQGLPVTGLLRVMAYNLLVILRAVHLRSDEARATTWQQLRDWMRDALVHSSLITDATAMEADLITP